MLSLRIRIFLSMIVLIIVASIVLASISIIQFKLEAQIIQANPDFGMENRLLLDKIDYKNGNVIKEIKSNKGTNC